MPRTMRVMFKPGTAVKVGGKKVALGNEEAEVTATDDGRFKLTIPKGEMAGKETFVDEDLFEPIQKP